MSYPPPSTGYSGYPPPAGQPGYPPPTADPGYPSSGGPPGYPPPPGAYPPMEPPPAYTPQGAQAPPPQQKTIYVQQKKSKGLFGSLMQDLSQGVDSLSNDFHKYSSDNGGIFKNFNNGNVVQLVSRSSGKALQIVQSAAGGLVVDGLGPEGPQFYHAHWTVKSFSNYRVQLINNCNYLAIVNGFTVLRNYPQGTNPGPETLLKMHCAEGSFIMFESTIDPGRHIAILPDGTLKSAQASGRDVHSQFGVRLIYSPHPMVVTPVYRK
ncbi:uncharacterized protein LOC141907555 [Tubulanus polymorphus]|uniref:uncharacterized protein LOC141907555 n=1 Tax=Tubulanus polymorphus TaxID=672921 RepID=UPI003DA68F2D